MTTNSLVQRIAELVARAIARSAPPAYERDKIALNIIESLSRSYESVDKEAFWQTLANEDELRWEEG